MSATVLKNARMELKTTQSLKQMLTRAAAFSGVDLTAFVLSSAEEKARNVIEHHDSLALSRDDQERFLEILSQPPKPPAALKKLMGMARLSER
ncbi:MAG: DUF1778 domain-containing protein [Halioglobus sp.]